MLALIKVTENGNRLLPREHSLSSSAKTQLMKSIMNEGNSKIKIKKKSNIKKYNHSRKSNNRKK